MSDVSKSTAALHLRNAREGDLSTITDIYADAVKHGTASYELEPPTLAEMQGRFRALAEGAYPYIVAEIAGAVAGYAYAGPFRPRPAYRFIVEDSVCGTSGNTLPRPHVAPLFGGDLIPVLFGEGIQRITKLCPESLIGTMQRRHRSGLGGVKAWS